VSFCSTDGLEERVQYLMESQVLSQCKAGGVAALWLLPVGVHLKSGNLFARGLGSACCAQRAKSRLLASLHHLPPLPAPGPLAASGGTCNRKRE